MKKTVSFCAIASLLAGSLAPLAEARGGGSTITPIQHIVVIFGENVSFDHYFGTYPNAVNPPGEPRFFPKAGTPKINGLSGALLTNNPNKFNSDNGAGATNPFRLDRSQAVTADQDHAYLPEQQAVHNGLMDLFPKFVGNGGPPPAPLTGQPVTNTNGLTMGYYDGNTVTALWNYAQHFAMNDNSFGSTFGPSTPGAINLISGQTNGIAQILNGQSDSYEVADGNGNWTLVGDADPIGDVCSAPTRNQVQFSGKNIGDLLSASGITWGAFMGGFDLTKRNANGTTGCNRSTGSSLVPSTTDYIPHHAWFQYYASTLNAKHTRPSSVQAIGKDGDAANHEYDIHDFFDAVRAGNFPAVNFLKAPAYQDGHAGYSDPLDEQAFLVKVINFLQSRPEWSNTAVVIAYDDSDGWYDHQMGPIVSQSESAADGLTGPGACGSSANALNGANGVPVQGRCGYGPRLPLLVISPWAKQNFVDHTLTDQSSVIRFIEDNWLNGERTGEGSFDNIANSIEGMFDFRSREPKVCDLYLDEVTGQPIHRYGENACRADSHRF
jgi:phospholipase C